MNHLLTTALLACLFLSGPTNSHGQVFSFFGMPMGQNITAIAQPTSVDLQAAWNAADQGLVDLATGAGQALEGLTAGLLNLFSEFLSGIAQAFGSVSNMFSSATVQDPLFPLIANITAATTTTKPLRPATKGGRTQGAGPGALPVGATVERLTAADAASLSLPRSGRPRKAAYGRALAPTPAPAPAPAPAPVAALQSSGPSLIRMRTAQTAQGAPAFIGNLRAPVDLGGR
eukprot:jgi/Botrbrau1/20734/Bobra.0058s0062.1